MAEGLLLQIGLSLTTVTCCSCKGLFAVQSELREKWKMEGSSFYCPHCGQGQHYSNTEVERLKNQVKSLEKSNTELTNDRHYWFNEYENAVKSKKAYKGHVTRIKNKIKNGNCPCCDKHFEDLRKHLETEHPEFLDDKEK